MAAFPNTEYCKGSQVAPLTNIALDVAADGTMRGRKLHTKETYDVTLVHLYVDETAANDIEDFYESAPTQQVDVTWRGVTYNCYWAGKPVVEHFDGGLWTVTSRLSGVRSDGG